MRLTSRLFIHLFPNNGARFVCAHDVNLAAGSVSQHAEHVLYIAMRENRHKCRSATEKEKRKENKKKNEKNSTFFR